MPTEEELEQRVNDHLDREEARAAILKVEIENLRRAVVQVENVSGFPKS